MKFPRLHSAQRKTFHFSLSFALLFSGLAVFHTACSNRQVTVTGVIPPRGLKQNKNPAGGSGANASPTPDKTAETCENFKASLPKEWIQDTVEVEENPTTPNGHKIKVFFYAKIKADSTPILFLNNGPGLDSHRAYRRITEQQLKSDPDQQLSFVFMDARGNGCSDVYPPGKDAATIQRLSLYGSEQIVSDAEKIRDKLVGNQTWMVYGQGFGGFIAHRYAVLKPQSLKSIFIHGNALTSDSDDRNENRIKAQVALLKTYLAQYPADEKNLKDLHAALTHDQCFVGTSAPGSLPVTTGTNAQASTSAADGPKPTGTKPKNR